MTVNPVITNILRSIDSTNPGVSIKAIQELGDLGLEALPEIIEEYQKEEKWRRLKARMGLLCHPICWTTAIAVFFCTKRLDESTRIMITGSIIIFFQAILKRIFYLIQIPNRKQKALMYYITQSNAPAAVGILLESLGNNSYVDNKTSIELKRLLGCREVFLAFSPTSEQRECLYKVFDNVAREKKHYDEDLILFMIKLTGTLLLCDAAPALVRLSKLRRQKQIQSASNECLSVLREHSKELEQANVLLRGSLQAEVAQDELLRVVNNIPHDEMASAQLLRHAQNQCDK